MTETELRRQLFAILYGYVFAPVYPCHVQKMVDKIVDVVRQRKRRGNDG